MFFLPNTVFQASLSPNTPTLLNYNLLPLTEATLFPGKSILIPSTPRLASLAPSIGPLIALILSCILYIPREKILGGFSKISPIPHRGPGKL